MLCRKTFSGWHFIHQNRYFVYCSHHNPSHNELEILALSPKNAPNSSLTINLVAFTICFISSFNVVAYFSCDLMDVGWKYQKIGSDCFINSLSAFVILVLMGIHSSKKKRKKNREEHCKQRCKSFSDQKWSMCATVAKSKQHWWCF